jgi:protein-disulfide isomerase
MLFLVALAPSPAGTITNKSLGSEKAPIRIQVFTDFACPACAAYHLETLRPLRADYVASGKVHLTYYVLASRQRVPAYRAACYANAAARHGHFAEVADALYRGQHRWIQAGEVQPVLAEVLAPVDLAKIRKELQNEIDLPLDADLSMARALQIRNVPTSIVTCRGKSVPVVGAVSYDILRLYLDRLLKEQE